MNFLNTSCLTQDTNAMNMRRCGESGEGWREQGFKRFPNFKCNYMIKTAFTKRKLMRNKWEVAILTHQGSEAM